MEFVFARTPTNIDRAMMPYYIGSVHYRIVLYKSDQECHSTLVNKYLKIGLLMVIASGVSAVYLDVEGFDCLSKLSKVQRSEVIVENLLDLERNCFIITNSYVYSLFGVIIGVILIVIWYTRYRRWSYKENKRWTR
jgi:hypothetical protein